MMAPWKAWALAAVTALSGCKAAQRAGALKANPALAADDVATPWKLPVYEPSSRVQEDDVICGARFDVDAAGKPLSAKALAQRDEIMQLLALAVVVKDWEFKEKAPRRGHNIGGVIVGPDWKPVWWERNSNKATCNGTQHGETRMMVSYLNKVQTSTLRCHQIFTSLEPCAMCSGMMTLQSIRRTVYGETDFDFGKALERLHMRLDKRNGSFVAKVANAAHAWVVSAKPATEDQKPEYITEVDGQAVPEDVATPFPRSPTSVVSGSEFRAALDQEQYLAEVATKVNPGVGLMSVVDYLLTDGTRTGDECVPDVLGVKGDNALPGNEAILRAAALGKAGKLGCAKKVYLGAEFALQNFAAYIAARKDPLSFTMKDGKIDPQSGTPLAAPVLDRARGVELPGTLLPENQAVYQAAVDFYNNEVTDFYLPLDDHIAAAGKPEKLAAMKREAAAKFVASCRVVDGLKGLPPTQ